MQAVQKVGLFSLLAIVAFAVIFALLPTSGTQATNTAAQLQDVQLTLYPTRDPDALWRFSAAHVTNDTLTGTTELSGLSAGQRFLRTKNAAGGYSGGETLDATLTTPKLTINGQDDLLTDKARMTLIKECTDIDLIGSAQDPVKIQQGVGFSAPETEVSGPAMHAKVANLQMDFQTTILSAGRMELIGNLDATETCRDGQRVTLPKT